MTIKNMLRHEQRVKCLIDCKYYSRCITKCGANCKHLGGHKIPRFKVKQVQAV